jgi:dihydroxyacetone kinase-like protein
MDSAGQDAGAPEAGAQDGGAALRARLIDAAAQAMIAAAEELTALDQAIGDGDHGLNMRRGFEAVAAQRDAIAALPWPDALKKAGTVLVMTVGGASGPLYGTLLMELGKAWPATADRDGLASCFAAGIEAVKRRGKSDVGQKTMLDVLAPALAAFAQGADPAAAADEAAAATAPMTAVKGRASFLGPRSVGHVDPGARSSALLIRAAIEALP